MRPSRSLTSTRMESSSRKVNTLTPHKPNICLSLSHRGKILDYEDWHWVGCEYGHIPHGEGCILLDGYCKLSQPWRVRGFWHSPLWSLGCRWCRTWWPRITTWPVPVRHARESIQVCFKGPENVFLYLSLNNCSSVFISFGGLLMSMTGQQKDLKNLEIDSRVYLLLK